MKKSFPAMAPRISKRDPNLCQDCQYCRKWVYRFESCIGCCACHFSCSYCAVKMEERASWETITIHFAGKPLRVPSGISVKVSPRASRLSNPSFSQRRSNLCSVRSGKCKQYPKVTVSAIYSRFPTTPKSCDLIFICSPGIRNFYQ
jgi:ferredoxin